MSIGAHAGEQTAAVQGGKAGKDGKDGGANTQGAVAEAQAMLARGGRPDPHAFGLFLKAHPGDRDAVLHMLTQTLGTGFVREAIASVDAKPPVAAPSGPSHLRVTADGLNVRSSPDETAKDNIIGGVHHGAHLEGLGREGAWIRITYHGQPAFVHGGYVEPLPAPAVAEPERAVDTAKEQAKAPPPVHEQPDAAKHVDAAKAAPPPAPVPAATAAPAASAPAPAAPAPAHVAAAAPAPAAPPKIEAKPEPKAEAKVEAKPVAPAAPAAPAAKDAAAGLAAANAGAVRAENELIVSQVDAGTLTLAQGLDQLAAFDRAMNHGTLSPTGAQLVATMPGTIEQHRLARIAKTHAAGDSQPAGAKGPPATATTAATAPAVAKAAPTATVAETAWTPPAGSKLSDPQLLALAAKVHDPHLQTLLEHIGGIVEESKLAKKQTDVGNNMEYTNAEHRDALVRGIDVVRGELEKLDAKDPNVAPFKVAVYHEIERIAPYHFQKNIRAIETWDKAKDKGGKRQWTTCNLTSLAMCLEVVGINSRKFPAEHEDLLEKVAKLFEGDINEGKDDQGDAYQGAVLTAKGKGTSLDKVRGFRLPDFLELAAIVYATIANGHPHTNDGLIAGANDAANQKGTIKFLKGLATFMGATPTAVNVSFDSDPKKNTAITQKLESYGSDHRGITTDGVEKMNTQRNLAENADAKQQKAKSDKERKAAGKEHDKAQGYYEKLDKTNHKWLDDAEIEKTLPIKAYQDAVTAQLGKHLDAGQGVIAGLSGHYVRLYEITDTGVCVQDPGQWNRTEMRITWAEARAMGYFWVNLVISS